MTCMGVRSIGRDPFKAIYFLEEEMGRISPQTQLFDGRKRDLVKRYIEHFVHDFDITNSAAMRSTNVEIDDEKLYGLTFVSGVVPKREKPSKTGSYKERYLYQPSSAIIYLPTTVYKYGEFIILEDAFADDFSCIHTIFDEDLKMEKMNALMLDSKGRPTVIDDEDRMMLAQHYDFQALAYLFESLLSVTHYGLLQGRTDRSLSIFVPFRGIPHLEFPGNMNYSRINRAHCGIYFPKLIMLAAARRLLRTIYPGKVDGEDTFDKQITRRFFAQYIYLDKRFNCDFTRTQYACCDNIEAVISDCVDRCIRIIKEIELSSFMDLPLEIKYLFLDDLYDSLYTENWKENEKEDGYSQNEKTSGSNHSSCIITTAEA